jgi:outer membrane protein OmpA-like peptidoglycan-associated protein
MEALKHNWFLRGFFKDRGYFNSSELTRHAVIRLPNRPPLRKFTFSGKELFDRPDSAKLKKEKLLDQAGKILESNSFGLVVVVAHTGLKGGKEENLTLSQARATVVRESLAKKFRIDDALIKTLGFG